MDEVSSLIQFESLPDPWLCRAFIDDVDTTGTQGGQAYSTYGVSAKGATVVIRPDGYVGVVAPLDKPEALATYFAAFML